MRGKPLGKRELEASRLAAKGLRNKAIAKAMGLTERTAREYLHRSFGKLGVTSRIELAIRVQAGCPGCEGENCPRCHGRGFV